MTKEPFNGMNPVSIIALFAALSETSAATALPFLAEDNQDIYVWFLIIFPSALTFMFFLTLNFNHKVLYAPSDFSNEKNFLKIFKRTTPDLKNNKHTEPTESPKLDPPQSLPRLFPHPTDAIDVLYGGPISSKSDIEHLLSLLGSSGAIGQHHQGHKARLILLLKTQNNVVNYEALISLLKHGSAEYSHAVSFAILDADASNITFV